LIDKVGLKEAQIFCCRLHLVHPLFRYVEEADTIEGYTDTIKAKRGNPAVVAEGEGGLDLFETT
jgi:hypothetical protein